MRRQARGWGGSGVAELRERWAREDVYVYAAVGSTNDVARELADGGAPAGTIVLGRTQDAGRGRGGTNWVSPSLAGVYLSMLFQPEGANVAPLVTVLAGIDVARSINRAFGGADVTVKWPNDLMARDRKLGGILAEASQSKVGSNLLVLGVGINVRAKKLPADLAGAIAFDELDAAVELVDVADAVISGLERRLLRPPTSLDEAGLAEADGLDWLRNRQVKHALGDAEPVLGTACGIAPDGALLLRPARGALKRVVAGSIVAVDV